VQRLLPKDAAEPTVPAARAPVSTELTEREREVLTLLAHGRDQAEIAAELFISDKTVETHIQHVLSKLDVHSRAQAVAVAHCEGLVDRPRPRLVPAAGSV
jgi:DNA-binding NarL/FixJ family response regulator